MAFLKSSISLKNLKKKNFFILYLECFQVKYQKESQIIRLRLGSHHDQKDFKSSERRVSTLGLEGGRRDWRRKTTMYSDFQCWIQKETPMSSEQLNSPFIVKLL